MRRKELSLFFSLTKEEQGQLIEEARRDFIQRHGKVTFWVFWIAAQLAGIAVLSFFVGFGMAAFLYMVGAEMPNFMVIGASVALAAVFVWPVLSVQKSQFY